MSAQLSPAQIDFARQSPEIVRGVRAPTKVNFEALSLAFDNSLDAAAETGLSRLKRERLKAQLMRDVRRHGLAGMDGRLRFNYCKARLWLGDFSDYWGWEFRDFSPNETGWAAHLMWEETWLPKFGGGFCKRLLVLGEQGIGDTIFIGTILPEAMTRCVEVIFECDPRLHTLLERSLPGLKCRPERQFEDRREDYGQIDAFIPAFDLMRMFRRDRGHFPGLPYLKPDQNRLAEVEKYRGRVGIMCNARQGSINSGDLGIKNPISLQYRPPANVALKLLDADATEVEQPDIDMWADIEGVVALTSVLEKIVCVPNTVHHLAAAQGKRVEIIVPERKNPEARNLSPWDYSLAYNGGKLPWYRDAQVFEDVSAWRASCAGSRAP